MDRTPDGNPVLVPQLYVPHTSDSAGPDYSSYRVCVNGWIDQYFPTTRADYRRILTMWEGRCQAAGVHPFDATRAQIQAFASELAERGLMPATQAHYIIVIQSFYRYAHEEEFIERNPAARVRRAKVDDNVPRSYMSRPEAARFLAASSKTRLHLRARDEALAHVLVLNGLRVSEVCGLNIETMGHERGHQTIVVLGKGGTINRAPLAPATYWAIMNYIGSRIVGPVFLGREGERINPVIIRRRVLAIAKAAGLEKRLSPHSCRRTFITGGLDANIPLRDVQKAARHADPRSTARYDQMRDALDRHPTYTLGGFFHGG
jgi:site-specific recombinase XerD